MNVFEEGLQVIVRPVACHDKKVMFFVKVIENDFAADSMSDANAA